MKKDDDNSWASAMVMNGALPRVAWGQGLYVYDSTGKRYLDASGGPAVYCLGHSHPEVNEAIRLQLDKIAHGYRYSFTSDPQEELSASIAASTVDLGTATTKTSRRRARPSSRCQLRK